MRLSGLFKPEYLYRPTQLFRRIHHGLSGAGSGQVTVPLPWGWPVTVWQNETIGKSLVYLGIYDLAVSEVLWRLSDPGETALDLGANVGILTATLSRRVGPSGRVLSFEAHPRIAEELRANVAGWRDLPNAAPIEVNEVALSYREGEITFEIPYYFGGNHGVGYVNEGPSREPIPSEKVNVRCAPLDSFLCSVEQVGVAKMDVEGHEVAVLQGASESLGRGLVRDWIFEHHAHGPSALTDAFEAQGYSVFQIHKTLRHVELVPLATAVEQKTWEAQSYLATRDKERALARMARPGWQVLRSD
jgi:FkbM family methyltransferase